MVLKQRVTISDIAERCGASRTTVSLVLRDRPGISSETRDRVLAAAQELGYERRPGSQRHGDTGVKRVAILFRARNRSTYEQAAGVNAFYSWVLTGMESVAQTMHMNLIFGTMPVDDHNKVMRTPDHLLSQELDGLIMVGAFTEAAVADAVGASGCPVVVVDVSATPQRYDVVASDNVGGARAAVEHLIGAGHEHVALISQEVSNPNFADRARGYREAMTASGLRPVVALTRAGDVERAIAEARTRNPAITAMFVVNDTLALQVLNAATAMGYRVPETLSIVGFDDTDHAVNSVPHLSTMRVDKAGLGRHAVMQLAYRLLWPDGAPTMRVLSPLLIERHSVAPPPQQPGPRLAATASMHQGG